MLLLRYPMVSIEDPFDQVRMSFADVSRVGV